MAGINPGFGRLRDRHSPRDRRLLHPLVGQRPRHCGDPGGRDRRDRGRRLLYRGHESMGPLVPVVDRWRRSRCRCANRDHRTSRTLFGGHWRACQSDRVHSRVVRRDLDQRPRCPRAGFAPDCRTHLRLHAPVGLATTPGEILGTGTLTEFTVGPSHVGFRTVFTGWYLHLGADFAGFAAV